MIPRRLYLMHRKQYTCSGPFQKTSSAVSAHKTPWRLFSATPAARGRGSALRFLVVDSFQSATVRFSLLLVSPSPRFQVQGPCSRRTVAECSLQLEVEALCSALTCSARDLDDGFHHGTSDGRRDRRPLG